MAERLANRDCRLLTVLGPGGVGKSRLAIQAAREQVDRFEHGVYLVDLASVSAPELLADAILRALPGAPAGGAEPEQQLLSHLSGKQMLLVLDNLEQLQAGAGLLPRLLRAAPRLKLMATSRARLNLREEWLLLGRAGLPPKLTFVA
jgi:predicted ATPase